MPSGRRMATSLSIPPAVNVVRVRRAAGPHSRYTRFVMFGKRFLWVLIAVVVGLVVWISSDTGGGNTPRLVFSNTPQGNTLETVMMNPHYQGIDAKNQPYTVIAEKATQLDKERVSLEKVSADLKNGESWVAVAAATGEMNTETRQLYLAGGVSLFYEGGYEFRSEHAHVDVRAGTAYGTSPVEGQGPAGTLLADSFAISDQGKVIRFNGSVRMTLYP